MARPKQAITERLNAANVAISNALSDARIGKYLGEFGYQTPKLSEGKALYETADGALKQQVAKIGDKETATDREKAAEKTARVAYQDLAQVARAAFSKDKASLAILGLTGPMPVPLPLFLTMATTLFDNASHKPEVAQVLAQHGFTTEKLARERSKIVELSAAMQAQDAATGGAQQATSDQNKALEILGNWMSAFVSIAKVALRAEPQLLEKLGIPRAYPQIGHGRDGGWPGCMARKGAKADAEPSDERADKARRPASPVPSGAGGGLRRTALASLERAPPCRRSAALSCSPGASRAAEPYLRIGPIRNTKTKAQRKAPAKAAATRKAKKEAKGPEVH